MCKSKETVIHIVGAALILSLQYQFSVANVIGLGACPTINPTFTGAADPFVPAATAAAAGATTTQVWYLHRRYPSYHHGSLSCVKFTISTGQNAASFTNAVTITGKKGITKTSVTITGTITQRLATNFYVWDASFTSTGATISHLPTSLVVAAYDTTNQAYLVLFACTNYGLFNKQYSWVLTTSPSNTDTNIAAALNAANLAGVPTSKYTSVDQSFC